jgi:hypothetical protein
LLEPHARLVWQLIASGPDRRHWWHSINRLGTARQLRLCVRLVFHWQQRYQFGWPGAPEQLRLWVRLVFHRQRRFQLGWPGAAEQLRLGSRLVSFWYWKPL